MGQQAPGTLRRLFRRIKDFHNCRRGAAAIIFALSALPMLLAAGGAIDYTRYLDGRKSLQTALDAAVLAGSSADNNDSIAQATFSAWKFNLDGTVQNPTFTVTDKDDGSYYSGTVTGQMHTYFAAMAGIEHIPLRVTATALRQVRERNTGDTCMWLLSTGVSLDLSSSATLNANLCVLTMLGGLNLSSKISVSAGKVCLRSDLLSSLLSPLASLTALLGVTVEGCADSRQPALPRPASATSCTSVNTTTQNVALHPGTYCGTFDFNYQGNNTVQNVHFAPGIYVLTGGGFHFTGNANITGSDVTFFFADSAAYLDFDSSNITSTLTAPTSGSCLYTGTCGVLMYETAGLTSSTEIGFDAETGNSWTGDILLPSRNFKVNAKATLDLTGVLDASQLSLSSRATLNLFQSTASASGGYASYTEPRLVN